MKKLLTVALCLLLCASFLNCTKKEEAPKEEAAVTTPGDIVEIAMADGRFTTLVKAIEAAGLVETLKGKGPFTVFAPTDEAFAKLPEGTVADLLKPENKKKLAGILTYHVVAGKVMAGEDFTLDLRPARLGRAFHRGRHVENEGHVGETVLDLAFGLPQQDGKVRDGRPGSRARRRLGRCGRG